MAELHRNEDGTLPAYAWPGGYQMIYFCGDGSIICPECANKLDQNPPEAPILDYEVLSASDVFWEGEEIICENCNRSIESAYGVPEGDNND